MTATSTRPSPFPRTAGPEAEDLSTPDTEPKEDAPPRSRKRPWVVLAVLIVLFAAAIGSVVLYLFDRNAEADRAAALDAARSATVALTSINFSTADNDIQRVIDSGTGDFGDLFRQNLASYVQMVKDSQVTSDGKVASAALTSSGSKTAEALVAVTGSVKNASSPQPQQRLYRIRLDMVKEGDRWLVSKLDFVG